MPRRRRTKDAAPDYEAAIRQAETERDDADAAIGPQAEAVRETDKLDADVALGNIERAVARKTQNEARDVLRATVTRRDNATKTIEALRVRAIAAVEAEQEQLREDVGEELSIVDAAIAELDRQRQQRMRERAAVEARYAAAWESLSEVRRRFDPAAAAAHMQHLNAERQLVLDAVRGGRASLLPEHLQARAEEERERLARESRDSHARSLESNRREAAALGVTLDHGA